MLNSNIFSPFGLPFWLKSHSMSSREVIGFRYAGGPKNLLYENELRYVNYFIKKLLLCQ